MSDETLIDITIEQVRDYEFRVRFDGTQLPDLTTDEPTPLGHGVGPNPARLLLAAIANCLTASLLFALRKFQNHPEPLTTRATARLERNAAGRWRISDVVAELRLSDAATSLKRVDRALAQFEDFCIVTQSVREGVPVVVRVRDAGGALLHETEVTA